MHRRVHKTTRIISIDSVDFILMDAFPDLFWSHGAAQEQFKFWNKKILMTATTCSEIIICVLRLCRAYASRWAGHCCHQNPSTRLWLLVMLDPQSFRYGRVLWLGSSQSKIFSCFFELKKILGAQSYHTLHWPRIIQNLLSEIMS